MRRGKEKERKETREGTKLTGEKKRERERESGRKDK